MVNNGTAKFVLSTANGVLWTVVSPVVGFGQERPIAERTAGLRIVAG